MKFTSGPLTLHAGGDPTEVEEVGKDHDPKQNTTTHL